MDDLPTSFKSSRTETEGLILGLILSLLYLESGMELELDDKQEAKQSFSRRGRATF